jgi:hypothetical protein
MAGRAAAAERTPAADSPPAFEHPGAGASRAPSSTPLVSAPASASTGAGAADEGAGTASEGEADPLVSNGLSSPLCEGALGAGELSVVARRDCATSGFPAAPAPTGDYGIDVHIDTGALGLGHGDLMSAVQDLLVTPLWMALVWAVHALVVMLEWCFTIDVLDSRVSGGVGSGLRRMQATLTDPWLAGVLSVASVLALYNGLVRRRIAETVGQVTLTGAMMVAGMWVIADPTGTVGALGGWANRASLGTLAVAARGTPAGPGKALAQSMATVFAAVVEAPWCYLEFGNVGWCRDPSRLDPRLRAAGIAIAAGELARIGCKSAPESISNALSLPVCVAGRSAQAKALEHSAELLREAPSNGAIFLALPANGAARNSINEQGSLLRAICESNNASSCRGPTAAQAEFRGDRQTWSRVGGLLLIALGVLGMMLLLGFIALRLLASAIFSLLYLLLTPGMVLAPALGEGGRAVFRKWATQLLGAMVSKLLFSFVLGVVLAVLAILSSLQALGWWTQWLLMSAFWWGAYMRRHQALGLVEGSRAHDGGGRGSVTRRMTGVLDARKGMAAARWAKGKLSGSAPSVEQRRALAHAGRERARAGLDEQARRTLESEHRDASPRAHAIQERLSAKRTQLERVERERGKALADDQKRRAAELGHRGQRIEGEIEHEQAVLNRARRVASDGDQAPHGTARMYTRERLEEQSRFLEAQAALPTSAQAHDRSGIGHDAGERRDYARLAGLVGYGRAEYDRLDPGSRRAARLEIDRELALRKELNETAGSMAARAAAAGLGRRERRRADRAFDNNLKDRMREGGHSMPISRREQTALDSWREVGRAERGQMPDRSSDARRPGSDGSSVMRDLREVAARRKRQLGRGRD